MYNEIVEIKENTILKIKPDEVINKFNNFEKSAQEGFGTEEARFSSYYQLVGKVSGFFRQAGIEKSDGTKEIARFLFYDHSSISGLPIEFFIKVRDRLQKEVLADGNVLSGSRAWAHELSVIREEFAKEEQESFGVYIQEKQAREKIDTFIASSRTSVEDGEVHDQLTTLEEKRISIKNSAVEALSRNEDLAPEISKIREFGAVLRTVQQDEFLSDPDHLRDTLAPYQDLFSGTGPSLSDLHLRAAVGQKTQVGQALHNLELKAGGPDFIWDVFEKKGYIPQEILGGIEEIIVFAQLQETSKVIGSLPKAEKAKHLEPFLQKGISAGLLLEIIEGRYELPDSLIARQVDSILHFWDIYEKSADQKNGQWSLKRKLVTSAAVGMAVLIMGNSTFVPILPESISQNQSQAEQTIENSQKQNKQEQNRLEQEDKPYIANRGTEIAPQNSGVDMESFKKSKEITVWELDGENLAGYYRTGTASVFDETRKTWIVSEEISSESIAMANKPEINLSGNFIISLQRKAEIPTQDGYLLTKDGINTKGNTGQITVSETQDGNYIVDFAQEDAGKTVSIKYSLGKHNGSTIPLPTQSELKKMSKKFIEGIPLSGYSDANKQLGDLINDNSLSKLDKAKALENYIKTNFEYSLVRKYSDWYRDGTNTQEFVNRIFSVQQVDCDVANTALIAVLRLSDIPARMALGFSNNEGFLDENPKKLVVREAHGWVEAYIGGKWIQLDATPPAVSSESKDAVFGSENATPNSVSSESKDAVFGSENATPPAVSSESKDAVFGSENATPNSVSSESQDAVSDSKNEWLEAGKEVGKDLGGQAMLIVGSLELLSLAGLATSIALRRRNKALADKLNQEVNNRAQKYFGKYYQETTTENEKARIGNDQKLDKKAAFLKGAGLIYLTDSLYRRFWKLPRLEKKYSKGMQENPKGEPDVEEFYTEVLGYEENEVRKRLYLENFNNTRMKLMSKYYMDSRVLYEEFDDTRTGLWVSEYLDYQCYHRLRRFFRRSFQEEMWADFKKRITSQVYDDYIKMKQKNKLGTEPILTKEQFIPGLETLLQYKLVLRQMVLEKNRALQSVYTDHFGWLKRPLGINKEKAS